MNQLEYRGYRARVDFDAEDEILTGRIAGINDVVGFHGQSIDEVKDAFQEAVDDYLETCAALGKAPEKEYSGQLSVRISPDAHRKAALAASLAGKSLNKWTEEVIERAAATGAPSG